MMRITERAAAIGRAQRALQALVERPDVTRRQLGAARERLNACYRLSDPAGVWAAVTSVEESAWCGSAVVLEARRAGPVVEDAAKADAAAREFASRAI